MEMGQEHGQLQDLSSPVLNKLQQGFRDLRTCLAEDCTKTFTVLDHSLVSYSQSDSGNHKGL